MSVSAKTGAIAFSARRPRDPASYAVAAPGAPVKRLTSVNDEIASLPLGKSEVITFKNDDFEQNAILTPPPDFNPSKKYPLVLLIHGSRLPPLMTFSAGAQLMAAKGWLVLQPNYRGSDNLGQRFAVRSAMTPAPGQARCHRGDQHRESQRHRRRNKDGRGRLVAAAT